VEPDCRWPVLDWGKVGSDAAGPLVSDPLSSIRSLDKKIGVLNTFKLKSGEHKDCTPHENAHFLFW